MTIPAKKLNRRSVLIKGASWGMGLAASTLLPSCRSMDRWVLGINNDEEIPVVVVGAGLAGLLAAARLKKENIPFKLYESSSRIGGRILTLEDFNAAGQNVDLGGEWIGSDHEQILRICREFRVDVENTGEISSPETMLENGKKLKATNLSQSRAVFQKWYQNRVRGIPFEAWDERPLHLTLAEFRSLLDPLTLQAWKWQVDWEWGTEPKNISSWSWIQRVLRSGDPLHFSKNQTYRIRGGSHVLTRSLYSRVAGVIPQQFVIFQRKLIEVAPTNTGFQLSFDTPEGIEIVKAKSVVCTVPMGVVKNIKGFEQLKLDKEIKQAITSVKLGTHSMVAQSVRERVWRPQLAAARWISSNREAWVWDQAWRINPPSQSRTIVSSLLSSARGQAAGVQEIQELRQHIKQFGGGDAIFDEDLSHIQNWSSIKDIQGSKTYFAPGQGLKLQSALVENDPDIPFYFAGEAFSKFSGTMNGAVESALRVVQMILKKRSHLLGDIRSVAMDGGGRRC